MKNIIHIVAPSNTMADLPISMIEIGLRRLESLGFKPKISRHAKQRYQQLSENITQRLSDLQEAFADPNACGVMTVFGGYNSNDLLSGISELDFPSPKWFIGYSDITAILMPLSQQADINVIHGPGFASFCDPYFFTFSENAFLAAIEGRRISFTSPDFFASDAWYTKKENGPREIHQPFPWVIYRKGEVTGKIIGGNIDTLCALLGTPYFPPLVDKILFLESNSMHPGLFQRGLMQLHQAGVFKQIKGLILGAFPAGSALCDVNILYNILISLALPTYPIVCNVHCSHVDPMLAIPLNKVAKLSATITPSLTINYSEKTNALIETIISR